ncbi:MAG TPA: ATP-dependent zinc metalloprotease FtsH [Mycobacteriales bacterium]|nr:ATP-dependent zinc metalloprotease FtsH [Mycobacteriales bacterium]
MAIAQPDVTTDSGWRHRLEALKERYTARKRGRKARGRSGPSKMVIGLVASLLVLLAVAAVTLSALFSNPGGTKVTLGDIQQLSAGDRIERATLLDQDDEVVLVLRSVDEAKALQLAAAGQVPAGQVAPRSFPPVHVDGVTDFAATVHASIPSNGAATARLGEALTAGGVKWSVDPQSGQAKARFVSMFLLPVLILANIFALLFAGKSNGGAIGDVTNFGRVDDSARTGGSHVTFADVGGADEAVVELAEVRDYLRDPAKYKALGAAPPKGVLLFGPPGTGKTLLARAVAGEAGVPFFSVAGAEFVESLVGVGAARIRDLFRRVNAVAPAIVFIDELDAAGRKRGSGGGGGGTDEREQTLNQLLVEMDGFDVSTGVVVIAATNRPDILDPALMRPGRFDRHITVERPDAVGRERILAIHAHKKPLAADVDLARLADRCPGFTGADLASVVNEAALLTIRQHGSLIHQKELEEAVVRVLEGPQRRGRVLLPEERQRAAYHEIGHIVVAATLGRHEDIHRVTVLSRGRNVAAATFSDSEATLLTRSSLHNQLVATLGGIAAEELALGEGSTGAEQDLEHATELARDMVTRYGMSDVVGPVRLQVKAGEGFLGNDTELVELSDQTQREVEGAIRAMIEQARSEAKAILVAHRSELDGLAARLDAEETLEGEVLEQALAPLLKRITAPAAAPAARRTPAPRRTASANGRAKAGASRAKA